MADRVTVAGAVEGFHVAALVRALDDLGVLDALAVPATADDVGGRTGADPALLRVCLEYLAGRTGLVDREGDRYAVTGEWDEYGRALVRQYVGAYGRLSLDAAAVLRDPGTGPGLVDHGEQARGFAGAPTVARLVADLVLQLDLLPVLDLGCGAGTLLVELGRRAEGAVGWGVDASEAMCAVARGRVAAAGVADRATVVRGDAFEPGSLARLPLDDVRCVTAASLLNALWGGRGDGGAVAGWLRAVASVVPGRALVVADYFGRVGRTPPPWPPVTAVHDLVQALSGQGVPPAGHDAWRAAYADAGAQVLHVVEDEARSFFVHLVKLPGRR